MFIFSEKEQLRYAVVNVYKNGVYGYPCADKQEAEWRASFMAGLAYRLVVKPRFKGRGQFMLTGPFASLERSKLLRPEDA